MSKLKRIQEIFKQFIKSMVNQVNVIAICYSMKILLYKRELEYQEMVPNILD